ncbi:unnamed protein product [Trifolium pratense]|uniref:Uncharacterized protein n=1 Tax=Trifolium pratense TaxID=57577 RepID=A0ACB0JJZ5_TRIPR|nr:unnamed protein product [Trifolium pratense]
MAAHEVYEDHHNRRLLIIVLLLGIVVFCYYHQGTVTNIKRMICKLRIYLSAVEEDHYANGSDLLIFGYLTIKVAKK